MRHFVAASLVLLLSSLVFAQSGSNRGLVLTGSVLSVKPDYDVESDKRGQYVFEVDLYLQFKNETEIPLIIFHPTGFYGKKKLVFQESLSARSDYDESPSANPAKSYFRFHYDPFPGFLRHLKAAEPSKYRFIIIAPGGYYECRETLTVRKGYKLELKPKQDPRNGKAVPEYPELRVEYYLSLNDRPEGSDALELAKQRWKEFGELFLNSSGDYTIKSEIILNKPTD